MLLLLVFITAVILPLKQPRCSHCLKTAMDVHTFTAGWAHATFILEPRKRPGPSLENNFLFSRKRKKIVEAHHSSQSRCLEEGY